jgi:hypothetical protein
MAHIVQQHPTLAARSLSRLVLAVLVALLLATSAADAALTTSACLVQKRKAWITFRKCQGSAQVKLLKGKPVDLATCDTALQAALAKITAKATKAAIVCRYLDNSDSTITDFDTGLMWEKKIDEVLGSCWTRKFTWATAMAEFLSELNGFADPASAQFGHAGHTDWRLPTVAELLTLVDTTVSGCNTGTACIDPIFGPTVASFYWSSTTQATFPNDAWVVYFSNEFVGYDPKVTNDYVRAVRAGL